MIPSFFLFILIAFSAIPYIYSEELSLKQQLENNIPLIEIDCKNERHLLVERPNGKLACVYYETSEKLNWKVINGDTNRLLHIYELSVNGMLYDVEFTIDKGQVESMVFLEDAHSLLIDLKSTNSGKLTVEIPRIVLDSKSEMCDKYDDDSPDDVFYTLVDGEEVPHNELSTTDTHRSLEIPFKNDIKQIEIIGTCLI